MTAPRTLPPQPWMTDAAARAVLAALTAEGAEVRFVGGCVRNALLGLPTADVDLATPDPPQTVVRLLEAAGLKAVPTGIAHGTVTAVAEHKPFEVTTLRLDLETDGRRAVVAFTDDWEADAARRDLTMNALSCRPDGTLFDPFGGAEDLAAGRVRFVGDPRARIEEDYLRLLRFFRFQAHYGRVPPEPAILAIAEELAPKLAQLSGERVRDELLKTLRARDPLAVLEVMIGRGILDVILPEEGGTAVLAALLEIEPEAPLPDALPRLGALLRPEAAAADGVAARLRLSKAERGRLVLLVEAENHLQEAGLSFEKDHEESARMLRRLLYRLGAEPVADVLRLGWARWKVAGQGPARAVLERALAEAAAWRPRRFPLTGQDLLDLGLAPGPEVGELLQRLEDWWIGEDFAPTREDCLHRAKALAE